MYTDKFEPLVNRLWDHEVDVLPEGGGTGNVMMMILRIRRNRTVAAGQVNCWDVRQH